MRPLQDTMRTRFGASMEYPELPDSLFDRPPVYLAVRFTLRKKVNQKFRKNRRARKAVFVAAPFEVNGSEFDDDFTEAFGGDAFAEFFDDADPVTEEPASIGEEELSADVNRAMLKAMVEDDFAEK